MIGDQNDNQKESPAGLLYRFEGAVLFLFQQEKETTSRARECLGFYEHSEIKDLVTRGKALIGLDHKDSRLGVFVCYRYTMPSTSIIKTPRIGRV